jgi:hypothetical protein
MAGHSQERRKQLVVNAPLQGRLVLSMAWMPAVALAAIAILTGLYCSRLMTEAIETDSDLPVLGPLFSFVLAFELVAAVFLMINALKVSHRVAGPAHNICKSLQRIRSGDLAFTVQLRKGDYLGEVRDQLNMLLDWLNDNPPPGAVTRAIAAQQAAAAAADATAADPVAGPATAVTGAGLLPVAGTRAPSTAPRTDG